MQNSGAIKITGCAVLPAGIRGLAAWFYHIRRWETEVLSEDREPFSFEAASGTAKTFCGIKSKRYNKGREK